MEEQKIPEKFIALENNYPRSSSVCTTHFTSSTEKLQQPFVIEKREKKQLKNLRERLLYIDISSLNLVEDLLYKGQMPKGMHGYRKDFFHFFFLRNTSKLDIFRQTHSGIITAMLSR